MKKLLSVLVLILFLLPNIAKTQSIQLGVNGGLTKFLSPAEYSKKISEYGLGFEWESQIGVKVKIGFQKLPLKLTGIFNYLEANGIGYSNIVTPPYS